MSSWFTTVTSVSRRVTWCHTLQNVRVATTVTGVTRLVVTVWRKALVVMTRGSVRPDVRRDSPAVFVFKVRCLFLGVMIVNVLCADVIMMKWTRKYSLLSNTPLNCISLWDGSKGVINFPWIFYAMRSSVPFGHFRNISGHLFIWLACGSFR